MWQSTVYVHVTELKHFSLRLYKHMVSRPKKYGFGMRQSFWS